MTKVSLALGCLLLLAFAPCAQHGTAPSGYPHGYFGSHTEIKPSEIPIGTPLLVYYMPQTKKVNGQKIKYCGICLYTLAQKEKQ